MLHRSKEIVPGQQGTLNSGAPGVPEDGLLREHLQRKPSPGAGSTFLCEGKGAGNNQPPVCNTGVETAKHEGKEGREQVSMSIDWMTFTFPDGTPCREVIAWLGLTDCSELPHGRYGYRSATMQGNITVLYNGSAGMGVCVDISGKGCRQLVESGRVKDWGTFIQQAYNQGARFSRLDVAFDDKEGILDLNSMKESYLKGQAVSHFRSFSVIESYKTGEGGGNGAGLTLMFGSRKSDTLIRAYDKAAEQKEEGHWIRVEIQTRNENARALVQNAVNHGQEVFVQYLAGLLDFKEQGKSSQRERWKTVNWWQAFIGKVKKLRLSIQRAQPSMQRLWRWLLDQVSPSLAMLQKASGEDFSAIVEVMVQEGMPRVKPWKLAMVRA